MSASAKPYEKDSARSAEQVPGVCRKIDRHPLADRNGGEQWPAPSQARAGCSCGRSRSGELGYNARQFLSLR
jgi:hypothetical protein